MDAVLHNFTAFSLGLQRDNHNEQLLGTQK